MKGTSMILDTEKTWILERHANTGIWHIDTLNRAIETNLKSLLQYGNVNGYVPVGVFTCMEEADRFCDEVETRLKNRKT